MVKAELIYNPYIKKTLIKFNGHSPLIDSQVEKYDKLILQDWLDELPNIFHDEMNGFDFELEFSGPALEADELCEAFKKQKVSKEEVPIYFKNELEDRREKMSRIQKLMQWIYTTENKKFDIDSFSKDHGDVFDSSFMGLVLHKNINECDVLKEIYVSFECVNDIEELKNTVLTHVPIIYCITKENVCLLEEELFYFMRRKDVDINQLFFFVDDSFNQQKMIRTLKDLGIKEPKIVKKVFDKDILRYIEVYPLSEYIRNFISVIKLYTDKIYEKVKKENANVVRENNDIYKNINEIEMLLKRLKRSYSLFEQRDNLSKLNIEESIIKEIEIANSEITSWKKNKIKITSEKDAEKMAKEFNEKINTVYNVYLENLNKKYDEILSEIQKRYSSWYKETGLNDDFSGDYKLKSKTKGPQLENIEDMLISIKYEVYRDSKDIFAGIFKNKKDEPRKMVLEKEWHYIEWKSVASNKLLPVLYTAANEKKDLVDIFYKNLAEAYMKKLKSVIEIKIEEKTKLTSMLSDKEIKLQADNDWFLELIDKISEIERS